MAGEIELAMTHRMGADGSRTVCVRPSRVLEMVTRLMKWGAVAEICQSCQTLPAMSISDSRALCSRCREQKQQRFGLVGKKPTKRDENSMATLTGHAIVFDSRSEDLGGFREIIRETAVDRMLSEAADLRALWNHNSDLTLGRKTAGTVAAWKDARGLAVDIWPPKWAGAHVESVERGDIRGMSFGFEALEDDWRLEQGFPLREVLDMRVHEVSPVSFPAYPATDLRVVNADERKQNDDRLHRLRMVR